MTTEDTHTVYVHGLPSNLQGGPIKRDQLTFLLVTSEGIYKII